jgi:hypothetical protein
LYSSAEDRNNLGNLLWDANRTVLDGVAAKAALVKGG